MKTLAELMTGTRPVWSEANEGASGTETQSAASGADSIVAAAGADSQPAGGADSQPASGADSVPAAAKDDSWKDRRIAALTAQKAELARKLNTPPQTTQAPNKPIDPAADWDERLRTEAAKQAQSIVAVQTFNEKCNAAVSAGREEYGEAEFNASVSGLQQLVDGSDAASIANYQDFLESAIETGSGAALIFELGKDQNEAERILALPPKRRAIELAKKATTVAKEPEPSNASKPIRPIEPRGGRHEQISPSDAERSDNLSTADWMDRRNAEVASRAAR